MRSTFCPTPSNPDYREPLKPSGDPSPTAEETRAMAIAHFRNAHPYAAPPEHWR